MCGKGMPMKEIAGIEGSGEEMLRSHHCFLTYNVCVYMHSTCCSGVRNLSKSKVQSSVLVAFLVLGAPGMSRLGNKVV